MTFAELSFGAYVYGLLRGLTRNPVINWQKCPHCLLFHSLEDGCESAQRAWQPVQGDFEWRYGTSVQARWWTGTMSNDIKITVNMA